MKKLAIAILPLTVFLCSCGKKTETPIIRADNSKATFNNIYNDLAVQSKTVTISADAASSFYGDAGCRFSFPAKCFANSSGNVVSGNVDIQVAEYLNPADMIFSRVLPVSGGQPLISGGEVFVKASQNGETLSMRPGYTYQVNVPQFGRDTTGMKLFAGNQWEPTPISRVWWSLYTRDSLTPGGLVYNGDTITIVTNLISYCNIDRYFQNPDFQKINVNVQGATVTDSSIVSVYTVFDGYNAAFPLGYNNTGKFSFTNVPKVPSHLVVTAVIEDEFYGGILGISPLTGQTYTVNISKVDPKAFKAQVAALK